MCECQEQLVGYIYDEITPSERREFEGHFATCAECRQELEGLRSARVHLALWAPPEPELGFRLIRGASEPAPALPRRQSRLVPAFAFAAAAVIVLAVAAAIANVELRYGNEGVTIRTGWASAPGPASDGSDRVTTVVPAAREGGAAEFGEIERRLQQLEAALADQPATATVQNASDTRSDTRMSDTEMLRQVRRIVAEAQARQDTEMARRLLQVYHDIDRRVRSDLASITQGIGQFQGLTNVEIATQRDLLNQYIRTRQEK